MKSIFTSITRSLGSNINKPELLNSILSQFIENFEADPCNLQSVCEDKEFPVFIRQTNALICSYTISKPGEGKNPEFIATLFQFLSSLCFKHPIILDTIAANTNVDIIVNSLYSGNVENMEVVERDAQFFFPSLKFLAYISTSKHFQINTYESSSLLISVLCSLLTHPQLSAWCASIIANISFSNEGFSTYLKQGPLFRKIKTNIGQLVASSDQCVMIAAVAASTVLFSSSVDHFTALQAAIQTLSENIPLQITSHLVHMIIVKSVDKEDCSTCIDALIDSALSKDSFTCYKSLTTLVELANKGIICKDVEKLRKLIILTIKSDESFINIVCCSLLNSILTNSPDIFNRIDTDNKLFKKCLRKFIECKALVYTEKLEALIILMRSLFRNKEIPQDIVDILKIQEESIFMQFMRRIQNNDSFLSLQIFHFIFFCSSKLEEWKYRLIKVVIDSQFTTLVSHVLFSSSNAKTTQDALNAIIILSSASNVFGDDIVHSLVFINKENEMKLRSYEDNAKRDKDMYEIAISRNQDELREANRTIENLQKELAEAEKEASIRNQSLSQVSSDYENIIAISEDQKKAIKALHKKNRGLENKFKELDFAMKEIKNENEKIRRKLLKHQDIKDRNKVLLIKSSELQKTNAELQVSYTHCDEMLKKKTALIKQLQKDISEKEDIINGIQNSNLKSQSTIKSYESTIEQINNDKCDMKDKIEMLSNQLKEEQEKTDCLETANQLLKDEIAVLKSKQIDTNAFQAKFIEKNNKLKEKLINSERDRRKWETAARFANRVGVVKNIAVHDVYGSVFSAKN